MRVMNRILAATSLLLTSGCVTTETTKTPAEPTTGNLISAWSQIGPDGQWIARAIVSGVTCPAVTSDGAQSAMNPRGAATPSHPVTTCDAIIPSYGKNVSIMGRKLPAPVAAPNHIVIFGDTGCRLKDNGKKIVAQNCNIPEEWPLSTVASSIASEKADVVVHVGDYHYREAPCPANQAGCAHVASGYNWDAWLQDYLNPMSPVFAATPIIHVRGNHELCNRAGEGWFRYLEPRRWQGACEDKMPTYSVTVGDHRWVIVDSADEDNIIPSAKGLSSSPQSPTWLFTHRPVLTPDEDPAKEKAREPMVSAIKNISGLSAIFAGHWHLLSLNQFSGKSPPELIVGNGGTQLDPPSHTGKIIDSEHRGLYSGQQYYGFGYLRLDRTAPTTWMVVAKDHNGKPVINCLLDEKKAALKCAAVGK